MVDLIINGGSQTLDGTKNYDNVIISNGGVLYVTPYNGTGTTGTLILNVTGNVTVDSTSSINGNARGYRGGTQSGYGGAGGGEGAGGGASTRGPECNDYSESAGGAGGGGYGTVGGAGGWGYREPGAGGSTYGTTNGWDISMGSGAGAGGRGITFSDGCAGTGGPGGPGGAMITINASNITIRGTMNFDGGSGGAGTGNIFGSGGGGGASGGGILLNASNIDISSSTITAIGGPGGPGGSGVHGKPGNPGGGGRIKFFYSNIVTTGSTISAGTIYYEMAVTTGSASFTSNPSNARIWIDGTDKGVNTPNTISDLSVGSHDYTLKLTGYQDASGSFSVTAGQTTIISVNLVQLIVDITAINVDINPGPYISPTNLTVDVTWTNNGNIVGTFEPAITITKSSDGTMIRMNLGEIDLNPMEFITRSLYISNLMVDTYTICPDPN